MAFTVTGRVSTNNNGTATATYASGSFTPSADSLLVLAFAAQADNPGSSPRNGAATNPTGGTGLTWTERYAHDTDTSNLSSTGDNAYGHMSALFSSPVGSSPSSQSLTVDPSTTGYSYWGGIVAADITGHDATTPFVQAASVNSADVLGGSTGAATVTYGTALTVGSLALVHIAVSDDNGAAITAPTLGGQAMTAVYSQATGICKNGLYYRVITGAESNSVVTWTATGTAVYAWSAIAAEVAADPAGPTDVTGTPSIVAASSATGQVSATLPVTGTPSSISATSATGQITATADVTGVSTTITATSGAIQTTLYPASISGRKVLDQHGDVFLIKCMASWMMAQSLTDAEITTALTSVAGNGFNTVLVNILGGYQADGSWPPKYENYNGDSFWSGTPWQSTFGPGIDTYDWLVEEADRLGIVVCFTLMGAFGSTGGKGDWTSASNADMTDAGEAFATRYASYTNIMWHIDWDDNDTVGGTTGQRAEAFFEGVNNIEGSARPVRWAEVDQSNTTESQGWLGTTQFNATINCMYRYQDDSVVEIEAIVGETSGPYGDCEPPYVGAPHYGGNEYQQVRERTMAVFLEGGMVLNWGHEDWWSFSGFRFSGFGEGLDWDEVQASTTAVQVSYLWALLDEFVADPTWAPAALVTTGEGSGDTKAAAGASNTAALAYFPTSRTIEVDTTVISGAATVRLRWFDPTDNSYTLIAAEEAVQTGRSVTHPGSNDVGQGDWVLVADTVEAAPVDVTGVPSIIASTSATGQVSATVETTGTPSIIVSTSATGQVAATTEVVGAASLISSTSFTGQVVGTTPVTGTPSIVAATSATGQVGATAETTGAPSIIASTSATGQVAGILPVTGTASIVAATSATGQVPATAEVVGTGSTITATSATGQVVGSVTVTGNGSTITATSATGQVSSTLTVSGAPSTVTATSATGQVTATAEVVALATLIVARSAVGQVNPPPTQPSIILAAWLVNEWRMQLAAENWRMAVTTT